VDVFVEPFVKARSLIVVGATPVAGALARLARAMDYDVLRVVDARERPDIEPEAAALGIKVTPLDELAGVVRQRAADGAAVVASQGHYDEAALEVLLRADVPYVGLVASRKRGATVRCLLEENGVPGVAAISSPAGLDLGARTAPEVALSILAEIVQKQSSRAQKQTTEPAAPVIAVSTAVSSAVDPICGMHVTIATARHTAEVEGVVYYFCCANCRAQFLKDPQSYLASR